MTFRSIRFKILGLIAAIGIVMAFLLAWVAPQQAASLGQDVLENDVRFMATLLVEDLALGMQTAVLDDGHAIQQSLDRARSDDGTAHATVSNIVIYDPSLRVVKSLDGGVGHTPPQMTSELEVFDGEDMLTVVAPMRDAGGEFLGLVSIDFSKDYLHERAIGSIWISLAISLVALSVTLVLGLILGNRVGKPISRIASIAEAVSVGELDHQIDIKSRDEVGALAESFRKLIAYMNELSAAARQVAANDLTVSIKPKSVHDVLGNAFQTMVLQLTAIIHQLRENATQLASAANQISVSSEQMSQVSNEQARQVGQVSRAIERITATILQASGSAGEATEASRMASERATFGGEVVSDTISGMQKIADVVSSSAASIEKLAESANQIGHIVGVIDDIADQTNMLALNAAIEAARAGEQGRGFAVVADEVRKLAERTGKATGEITQMIAGIQDKTSQAVQSMESGVGEVQKGRELADRAGASLSEIVTMSQQVTDMVHQMAGASEEQAASAEEISKNVEHISMITTETAKGADQSASAAEELNRQAESLQEMVSRFRV